MVLQEPFLFTGTVLENIRYHKVNATREQVVEAAKAVGAHDFIMSLAEGYDTKIEQRGGNLSLGQRQLISFARALVADAKILVLDEATANIDSYTEMLIQRALKRLLEGRTGLVIAHRLATIRGADRIIVLQNGELLETGNHDQLMELGGLYAKLYTMNYASFDDLPEDAAPAAVLAAGGSVVPAAADTAEATRRRRPSAPSSFPRIGRRDFMATSSPLPAWPAPCIAFRDGARARTCRTNAMT